MAAFRAGQGAPEPARRGRGPTGSVRGQAERIKIAGRATRSAGIGPAAGLAGAVRARSESDESRRRRGRPIAPRAGRGCLTDRKRVTWPTPERATFHSRAILVAYSSVSNRSKIGCSGLRGGQDRPARGLHQRQLLRAGRRPQPDHLFRHPHSVMIPRLPAPAQAAPTGRRGDMFAASGKPHMLEAGAAPLPMIKQPDLPMRQRGRTFRVN